MYHSYMALQHNNETAPLGKPTDHQGHYVLELFKYIGDQRLKTFNYYALILAATTAATLTSINSLSREVLLLCGTMHVVVALVFWMIDCRNCELLFSVRKAMRRYENDAEFPESMRVMNHDEAKQKSSYLPPNKADKETPAGWHPKFTYTRAFQIAFTAQAALGVGLITWVLLGEPRFGKPMSKQAEVPESTVGELLHAGEH